MSNKSLQSTGCFGKPLMRNPFPKESIQIDMMNNNNSNIVNNSQFSFAQGQNEIGSINLMITPFTQNSTQKSISQSSLFSFDNISNKKNGDQHLFDNINLSHSINDPFSTFSPEDFNANKREKAQSQSNRNYIDENELNLANTIQLENPPEVEEDNFVKTRKIVLDAYIDSNRQSQIYSQNELKMLAQMVKESILSNFNFLSSNAYLEKRVLEEKTEEQLKDEFFKFSDENEFVDLNLKNILDKLDYIQNMKSKIGPMSPLSYLIESSFGPKTISIDLIQKKYEHFQDIIYKWRHINGDGNCFYRVVMFRYIELIILNNDISKLRSLIVDMIECFMSNEAKERFQIKYGLYLKSILVIKIMLLIYSELKQNHIAVAYHYYTKSFLTCEHFDFGLILYFRYTLYKYIKDNENKLYTREFGIKIGNLLPIEYETQKGEFLYEQFYTNYVLKMFKDAEKIIIYLTPFVLNFELNIVLYEENEKNKVKNLSYMNTDNSENPIQNKKIMSMSLLNKKDHYELIYFKEEYEKFQNIFEKYTYFNYEPKFIKEIKSPEVILINDFISDSLLNKISENMETTGKSKNFFNNQEKQHAIPLVDQTVQKEKMRNIVQISYSNNFDSGSANINADNNIAQSIIINKEEINCKSCKKKFTKYPKNLLQICENCLIGELNNKYTERFNNFIMSTKSAMKSKKLYLLKNLINPLKKNNEIQIGSQRYDQQLIFDIINEKFGKEKYNITKCINEMKSKICIKCEKQHNNKNYEFPCKCTFCSSICLKDCFKLYFNNLDFDFICICGEEYTITKIIQLYNILKQNNYKDEYKFCLKILDLKFKEKCASCEKIFYKEKNNYMVYYSNCPNEKNSKEIYHYLCEKCSKNKNFNCIFCQNVHFSLKKKKK